MALVESEPNGFAVSAVSFGKETNQVTLTKSSYQIKLCASNLVTALLVTVFLTTVFIVGAWYMKMAAPSQALTFNVTFQANDEEAKEEIRFNQTSEKIAVFDDLIDGFTVVLDNSRSIAVFRHLQNNTCYFADLEDIPKLNSSEKQGDEDVETPFFPTFKKEELQDTTFTITPTYELPGKYMVKTSNEIVSKICAEGISFWAYITEDAPTEYSSHQKGFLS